MWWKVLNFQREVKWRTFVRGIIKYLNRCAAANVPCEFHSCIRGRSPASIMEEYVDFNWRWSVMVM